MPCGWRRLQSAREVRWWLHLAQVRVEIEADLERLTACKVRSLAMTAAQRNARRPTHSRNRAPVGVAVQRDLHRRAHSSKDHLGIKGQGNEADRPISKDCRLEGLRYHESLHCRLMLHVAAEYMPTSRARSLRRMRRLPPSACQGPKARLAPAPSTLSCCVVATTLDDHVDASVEPERLMGTLSRFSEALRAE